MSRRGFTLAEVLVAMVVMSILGLALIQVLIGNAHFVSRQDTMMEARLTARAAMYSMIGELQDVSDGGLLAASKDSVTLRVPYAFGMLCGTKGVTTASLLPADSLTYATALPDSVAVRTDSGAYVVLRVTSVSGTPDPAECTADSIRVVPGGTLIGLTIQGPAPPAGALFFLSQPVTYHFRPSVDLPGRRALWRRAGSVAYEEMAAPFDSSARFAFLMQRDLAHADTRATFPTAPKHHAAALDSVRGLELRLTGASVATPQGASGPQTFALWPRVIFGNKMYVADSLIY